MIFYWWWKFRLIFLLLFILMVLVGLTTTNNIKTTNAGDATNKNDSNNKFSKPLQNQIQSNLLRELQNYFSNQKIYHLFQVNNRTELNQKLANQPNLLAKTLNNIKIYHHLQKYLKQLLTRTTTLKQSGKQPLKLVFYQTNFIELDAKARQVLADWKVTDLENQNDIRCWKVFQVNKTKPNPKIPALPSEYKNLKTFQCNQLIDQDKS